MKNKLYFFQTTEGKFVFDGDEVAVFQCDTNDDTRYSSEMISPPVDNHRSHFFRTICLVLNNSCNLFCSYCYANKGVYDKPLAQMSYESACSAIDMIAKSVISHALSEMTIAFFGGEPLLSFNLIKHLVVYCETSYPFLVKKYQITTNGTLITPDIAAFMEKYNFNIMISIDGSEKVHNHYRCMRNGQGSYDAVVKGISHINKKYLLNARMTITDVNSSFHTYIDSILSLGIKRITFAIDYQIPEKFFINYINSIKELTVKYINDIKNKKFYDITNLTRIISYIIFHNKCRTHCNAGVSYVTLSADGKYYQCPRFVGISKFCMGGDFKSVMEASERFKKKLKSSASERCKECSKCCFVFICGGVCLHHAYLHNGKIFNRIPTECMERETIAKEALNLLCSLNVEERRNFLLFLTSLWEKNNMKGGENNG